MGEPLREGMQSPAHHRIVRVAAAELGKCAKVRAQLCAKTWASPAYADGKMYVKDEKNVFAVALAP